MPVVVLSRDEGAVPISRQWLERGIRVREGAAVEIGTAAAMGMPFGHNVPSTQCHEPLGPAAIAKIAMQSAQLSITLLCFRPRFISIRLNRIMGLQSDYAAV